MSDLNRLNTFLVRLREVDRFVLSEIIRVVEKEKVWLEDKNREYMAKDGEKVTGESIQPRGYARSYISYKLRFAKHKNVKYVDLKFDGDFHKAVRVEFQEQNGLELRWKFINSDRKYPELKQRYGDLLGIREKDLETFMKTKVFPQLFQGIRNYLQSAA